MNDMTQFLVGHGGPVLFAIVLAEQAGLPLPSAPWLLAAGALSSSGKLNPALAIGLTASAAVLADSFWFYVGRRGGQRVLRLFCRLSLSQTSCVKRSKGFFARHGLQTLAAAKFLPGLGAVMPPLAGALGMSVGRFLLFDTLGSLFYGSFYIGAGFLFHNQLGQMVSLLNRVGLSAALTAIALVSGYVAFKYARRRHLLRRAVRESHPDNQTAELNAQDANVGTLGSYNAIASLPAQAINALQLPSIALAVTSSETQETGSKTAATLVSHSL